MVDFALLTIFLMLAAFLADSASPRGAIRSRWRSVRQWWFERRLAGLSAAAIAIAAITEFGVRYRHGDPPVRRLASLVAIILLALCSTPLSIHYTYNWIFVPTAFVFLAARFSILAGFVACVAVQLAAARLMGLPMWAFLPSGLAAVSLIAAACHGCVRTRPGLHQCLLYLTAVAIAAVFATAVMIQLGAPSALRNDSVWWLFGRWVFSDVMALITLGVPIEPLVRHRLARA